MIGLDTDLLLRYLTQDDAIQSPRATQIVEQQLSEDEPGFISLVTILETVWVLRRIFNRSRSEVADHIERLLVADALHVQNEQEVFCAMIDLRDGAGTFEDALIGELGIWAGCSTTLTFDEKAARRLRGFQLA